MKLLSRSHRARLVTEIANTTDTDRGRAVLMLQDFLDHGPASPYCEEVLPLGWSHVTGLVRGGVDYANAVEEVVAQSLGDDIDRSEDAERMFAEHPDLNQGGGNL